MTPKTRPAAADLLDDPGVLGISPILEIFGFTAVRAIGGISVLPLRSAWLAARSAGLSAVPDLGWVEPLDFDQAVVHLQKGRDATWEGLVHAWSRLTADGVLYLVGGNDLGIKSAVKRLSEEIGQPAEILSNRARARVAHWTKNDSPGPAPPRVPPIEVAAPDDRFTLESTPGAFSADGVDPGTALLLEHLPGLDPPDTIFDPGCGLGALGLAGLRRWPAARAVLADIDHRVVACAKASAHNLGLEDRCTTAWWDAAGEPPPVDACDLVLLNPPFHSGVPVDLQPARAIFRAIDTALRPQGRALIVANRTLPWERDLRKIGTLRQVVDEHGYKIIEIKR